LIGTAKVAAADAINWSNVRRFMNLPPGRRW